MPQPAVNLKCKMNSALAPTMHHLDAAGHIPSICRRLHLRRLRIRLLNAKGNLTEHSTHLAVVKDMLALIGLRWVAVLRKPGSKGCKQLPSLMLMAVAEDVPPLCA